MKTFIFVQKFIHIMIFPLKNDFQRQVKFVGTPGIKKHTKTGGEMCLLHKEIA